MSISILKYQNEVPDASLEGDRNRQSSGVSSVTCYAYLAGRHVAPPSLIQRFERSLKT